MRHIETLKALLENLNQQPPAKKVGIKFVTCWLKLILDEYEAESGHQGPVPYDPDDDGWIINDDRDPKK